MPVVWQVIFFIEAGNPLDKYIFKGCYFIPQHIQVVFFNSM